MVNPNPFQETDFGSPPLYDPGLEEPNYLVIGDGEAPPAYHAIANFDHAEAPQIGLPPYDSPPPPYTGPSTSTSEIAHNVDMSAGSRCRVLNTLGESLKPAAKFMGKIGTAVVGGTLIGIGGLVSGATQIPSLLLPAAGVLFGFGTIIGYVWKPWVNWSAKVGAVMGVLTSWGMQYTIRAVATKCMAIGADVLNKGGNISKAQHGNLNKGLENFNSWDVKRIKTFMSNIEDM